VVHLRLHQSFHWRLAFIIFIFLALLAAVILRVFSLAIVEHRRFALAAGEQQNLLQVIPSRRGAIYGQDKSGNLQPLAIQKTFWTLVAIPKELADAEAAAGALAGILGRPEEEFRLKLAKQDDPYEVLSRKLDEAAADRVRTLHLRGLALVEETRRVYPKGTLAASALGFVNYQDGEERGEYGIERHYDASLRGERGLFEGAKDASGSWVAIGRRILNPPVDGDAVVLTLDPNIQFRVESELAALREKWQAESAAAVVLEPKTGRILALAALPAFDPNEYARERDYAVFRVPIIDAQFELGSVFKPITMAAGIYEGVIRPDTAYEDPGSRKINGFTVSNFDGRSHGVQTMTQVLEKSLNTGAIFAGERLGKEKFLAAVKRFGFGEKTGVDFPGEVAGDISNLGANRDIEYATASFGQGIAVTPLQMAAAIGAVANHGVLMRPYLVEKIVDANGIEEVRRPQEVRRVVSAETAETVSKMLVSVVRNGFDKHAQTPGYFVAAKTGTAQIPLKDGRGYSDEVIHTFVGYAPAFDPKFLILIQLNRPKGNRFAANTITPAFKNLSEFLFSYFEIPPDERSGIEP